jgi:6-phosphogluconolactonase
MQLPRLLLSVGALALLTVTVQATEDFYVGTYTTPQPGKGIYHFQLDEQTGKVSGGELAIAAPNPSYLAIHPNGRWLYAVSETGKGVISAFTIGPDHLLQKIGEESTKGSGPCHLSLDGSGRYVFAANYGSGNVSVMPIQPNGGVGPVTGFDQQKAKPGGTGRQSTPLAHSIYADPTNRLVYSCDLGNDHVEAYHFDAEHGTIQPAKEATAELAAGSGPRHLVFHPRGYLYVINEMNSTVTFLQRDAATGGWRTAQTISTLPADFTAPNSTAEIVLHPNGKFLYGSNRGQDSIVVYAIAADGQLSLVESVPTGGKMPRNFNLDPTGRWLLAAGQQSNDIFVFGVNPDTGKLTATGQRVEVGAPVCVTFMPVK